MAWTAPRTWSSGEVDTAALMNAQVRDNMLFLWTAHAARVYRTATQSITSATLTTVLWDGEDFDSDALHSIVTNTSRLTVPAGLAGVWQFYGMVEFAANATGSRTLTLVKNGATDIATTTIAPPSAGVCSIDLQSMAVLAATDYVEAKVTQTSGGALNVSLGISKSYLECAWMGG